MNTLLFLSLSPLLSAVRSRSISFSLSLRHASWIHSRGISSFAILYFMLFRTEQVYTHALSDENTWLATSQGAVCSFPSTWWGQVDRRNASLNQLMHLSMLTLMLTLVMWPTAAIVATDASHRWPGASCIKRNLSLPLAHWIMSSGKNMEPKKIVMCRPTFGEGRNDEVSHPVSLVTHFISAHVFLLDIFFLSSYSPASSLCRLSMLNTYYSGYRGYRWCNKKK